MFKSENSNREPQTTIIYGQIGSGKTQLVRCAVDHVGYEIFELCPSELSSQHALKRLIQEAKSKFLKSVKQPYKRQNSCKLPLLFIDDADVYFEDDERYMQNLMKLIETTKLPLVLTATDQTFATKLCNRFDESKIQLMTLSFEPSDLVFQVQHFVTALFLFDFDNKQIANIVNTVDSDMRSVINTLHFFYAPIMMRSLHEYELSKELFDIPPPIFESQKLDVDVRDLAELQFEAYRCGLMKLKASSKAFFDELGYIVDKNTDEKFSILNEVYVEMLKDLSSDYNEATNQVHSNDWTTSWW